jgi:hypothetical protein
MNNDYLLQGQNCPKDSSWLDASSNQDQLKHDASSLIPEETSRAEISHESQHCPNITRFSISRPIRTLPAPPPKLHYMTLWRRVVQRYYFVRVKQQPSHE